MPTTTNRSVIRLLSCTDGAMDKSKATLRFMKKLVDIVVAETEGRYDRKLCMR
jgi:hypothetical protein